MFHAYYKQLNNNFICYYDRCTIAIPSIVGLPFNIIYTDFPGLIFLGSKKMFSSLKNRDYKILELNNDSQD